MFRDITRPAPAKERVQGAPGGRPLARLDAERAALQSLAPPWREAAKGADAGFGERRTLSIVD